MLYVPRIASAVFIAVLVSLMAPAIVSADTTITRVVFTAGAPTFYISFTYRVTVLASGEIVTEVP